MVELSNVYQKAQFLQIRCRLVGLHASGQYQNVFQSLAPA